MLACGLTVYLLSPQGRLRTRLGARTLAVIQHTRQVEAFTIDPAWKQTPARPVIGRSDQGEPNGPFPGFEIVQSHGSLSDLTRRQLVQLLQNNDTYTGRKSDCDFAPTVALRLKGANGDALEVLLSPECRQIELLTRDATGHTLKTTFGDFDRNRTAWNTLLDAAKRRG